jgi:hypothetical protein
LTQEFVLRASTDSLGRREHIGTRLRRSSEEPRRNVFNVRCMIPQRPQSTSFLFTERQSRMRTMASRQESRSSQEDYARGRCRAIARDEGSFIRKTNDKKFVIIASCERWPEDVLVAFHGWTDLLEIMTGMISEPKELA